MQLNILFGKCIFHGSLSYWHENGASMYEIHILEEKLLGKVEILRIMIRDKRVQENKSNI